MILAQQGEKSPHLAEIYCFYSFFYFQARKMKEGIAMQRKATHLVEQESGQLSENYIMRLFESAITMKQNGCDNLEELHEDFKKCASLATQHYESEKDRLTFLNALVEIQY